MQKKMEKPVTRPAAQNRVKQVAKPAPTTSRRQTVSAASRATTKPADHNRGSAPGGQNPVEKGVVSKRPYVKPASPKAVPNERYRVEGIGRKGVVRFVKVIGTPGQIWRITGLDGLNIEVVAKSVDDAVRIARRQIGFRPFAIRPLD